MNSSTGRVALGGMVAACVLTGSALALHPDFGWTPAGWPGFAYNAQHWAQPGRPSQPLVKIKWSAVVDESGGLGHYGSPMMTRANTVVFPVRGANDKFRVEGRKASDGTVIWSLPTGWVPPPAGWVVACGASLTRQNALVVSDSGGRVLRRASADAPSSTTDELVFYGAANYNANPGLYNNVVKICTPITADHWGNLFFGYEVSGNNPINLKSGIARISATGQGSWVSAAQAANDASIERMPYNCAPGLGLNGTTLYVGVRDAGEGGYLVCLDSTSLTMLHRVRLKDPGVGIDADMTDYSTASPTIGPDGQVFIGVLDTFLNNNDRGWMLHYSADLTQTLAPGAFGWDNTVAIIPASSVGLYQGNSPYLLLSKYNNYAGIGNGDGVNKIAVLDPNATQVDQVSGKVVMKEIITKVGPTKDPQNGPNAVREWCINTAAVDVPGHAGLVNNEDGLLYRWDFDTNTLSEKIALTGGTFEAYTPTEIGPDGTVYAINGAVLFAVGQ